MKWLFIIILIMTVIVIILVLFLPGNEIIIKKENQNVHLAEVGEAGWQNEIIILAAGDIMLSRGVEYMIVKNNDFLFPFRRISEYLKGADILLGNLEGPISDKGTKVGSIYSFRADPRVIEGLTYAGFNVLSLANNHMFDYGREALEDTFKRLTEAGINYIGGGFNEKEAYEPLIKEVRKTKIAFLAYTDLGISSWRATSENSGIAWVDNRYFEKIKKDINLAKEKSDILIVSLHSGEEYQIEPNAFQEEFSEMAIEAGADLVIGHHPHVVQKTEKYKEGFIAYSLGNLIFDQGFSEETTEGLVLEIVVKNGKIKEINPREIKISSSFQPYFEPINEI